MPFRAHVDALIRHLMPPVELAARSIAGALSQLPRQVEDALRLAQPGHAADGVSPGYPPGERLGALQRQALLDAAGTAVRAVESAIAALEVSLESAYSGFRDDLLPGPARDAQREVRWQRRRQDGPQLFELELRRDQWSDDELHHAQQLAVLSPYRAPSWPVSISRGMRVATLRFGLARRASRERAQRHLERALARLRERPSARGAPLALTVGARAPPPRRCNRRKRAAQPRAWSRASIRRSGLALAWLQCSLRKSW